MTLRSLGDAVIATDAAGRVTMLNGVAEALTGWTDSEAAGRPLGDVFVIINEESRRPAESPVEKVLRAGVISGLANHTVLVARTDARSRSTTALPPSAPRPGTCWLRTPLTTILGWVRMLRTARLEPSQRERALDTIERNTRVQARMIDDLLDMSRIAAGKMALELRPISVGPLIAETVESLQHEARAKGLVLETNLDGAAGTVSGDADRLRQVLVNLLVNAVKYTPSGRVDVVLTTRAGVVRIVVGDTGIGIEGEMLPHVFERFRQADWKSAGTQSGLGLGLAIVRQIVGMHGGTVEAQSDGLGRGATFVVTLPVIPRSTDDA